MPWLQKSSKQQPRIEVGVIPFNQIQGPSTIVAADYKQLPPINYCCTATPRRPQWFALLPSSGLEVEFLNRTQRLIRPIWADSSTAHNN
mmetsp:Transcript_33528/g.60110  ORF Transcript_33528/g.60110 Transcript_33528/m.60110 type:complete len:89 (-) Transcript_33528:1422-1688(-)